MAVGTSLSQRGITLLISSHVMDEAARCDEVLLFRDGELLTLAGSTAFVVVLVAAVAARIGPRAARHSQVVGLAMARKVVRIEPLASASPEWLSSVVGPTIQRYLTGRLATATLIPPTRVADHPTQSTS